MDLTLKQKIGQKLVTGFESTVLTPEFINAIKTHKIGNVILFKENVESEEQLLRICNEINELILKETGLPAFITVDQEGGMVCRMPQTAANVPGAMAIAATGDKTNAYLAGLITAKEMRYFGMNFDLAPVIDVNSNCQNPIIGVRSYGDNPQQVIDYSLEMIKGLSEGGVLASVKHFPGHGDTSVDSHLALPIVDKSFEELLQIELKPFIAAIKNKVPAITTTHILFPQLDNSGKPATMSRLILTDLLRKKLGFEGLIVSDCMEMKAIADYFGTIEGSVEAVKAGVDLVYISHNAKLAGKACEAIINAVENNEILVNEIDESIQRIVECKQKLSNTYEKYDRVEAKQCSLSLLQKSICVTQEPNEPFLLGNNPICMGSIATRITLVGNVEDKSKTFGTIMCEQVGGTSLNYSIDPTDEDIANALIKLKGHTSAVIGSYNAHLHGGQKKLIAAVAKSGIQTVVIALRNPYDLCDLDKKIYAIAAFEYTEQAIIATAKVLLKNENITGKMPVALS